MGESGGSSSLHTDRPIEKISDDALGRKGFAEAIARQIQVVPRSESFVLAVVGEWGIGKTSILNMVEEALRWDSSHVVLWFNPWMFSGQEQLVAHFFQEIAAQLREKEGEGLRNIWRGFEGYSRALEPLRPVPNDETRGEARGPSVTRLRTTLEAELRRANQRLVIVIDDIDRLIDDDIREMMRLVRLVGDFPNVVYLLSYDEDRVAKALGAERGADEGRAYLEKIVQVVQRVPRIRRSKLAEFLSGEIDKVTRDIERRPDGGYEQEVRKAMESLFGNLRDVHRYINSVRPTLDEIGNEVALPDVLALEALRVLRRDVFKRLELQGHVLTDVTSFALTNARADNAKAKRIREIVDVITGVDVDANALLELLFPFVRYMRQNGAMLGQGLNLMKQWEMAGRVAYGDFLNAYMEVALPPGVLAPRQVRAFLGTLADEQSAQKHLDSLVDDDLQGLMASLYYHVEEIELDLVGTLLFVACEQYRRAGPSDALRTLVSRCMRRIRDDKLVFRVYQKVTTSSARLLLLEASGGREFLGDSSIEALQQEIASSVVKCSPDQIRDEPELLAVLVLAARYEKDPIRTLVAMLIRDDEILVRLVRSGWGWMSEPSRNGGGYPFPRRQEWWSEFEEIVDRQTLVACLQRVVTARSRLGRWERRTFDYIIREMLPKSDPESSEP